MSSLLMTSFNSSFVMFSIITYRNGCFLENIYTNTKNGVTNLLSIQNLIHYKYAYKRSYRGNNPYFCYWNWIWILFCKIIFWIIKHSPILVIESGKTHWNRINPQNVGHFAGLSVFYSKQFLNMVYCFFNNELFIR